MADGSSEGGAETNITVLHNILVCCDSVIIILLLT